MVMALLSINIEGKEKHITIPLSTKAVYSRFRVLTKHKTFFFFILMLKLKEGITKSQF